jgi:hypothetical protein
MSDEKAARAEAKRKRAEEIAAARAAAAAVFGADSDDASDYDLNHMPGDSD